MPNKNWDQKIILDGQKILREIDSENITPKKSDVLNFLELDPNKIKVVILGQDPYPGKGVANGRAFAIRKDVTKMPPTLKNIFNEIKEVTGKLYTDQTLESWEKQGVLLLNVSLSTIIGQPRSHYKKWNEYTKMIISWLSSNFKIDWILWGQDAIKMKQMIVTYGQIICDSHPSPLSFYRRNKDTFSKIKNIKW